MRRREFIAGLGMAAWPLARAQSAERVRRVAVLSVADDSPAMLFIESRIWNELAKLGWVEGRNLRLDIRRGAGDADRIRTYATELVNLNPDLIVAIGAAPLRAVQDRTQSIPIVLLGGGDVYASGRIRDIAHPDGNVTGIVNLFESIGGKWVQLLKDAVPQLERVAYVYIQGLQTRPVPGYFASVTEAAHALGIVATELQFHDAADLVHAIDAFAAAPNGALIISPPATIYQDIILAAAFPHRLPTVGAATRGALIGYNSTLDEIARRGASFIDRILRGTKVNDLPVEYPTRFELIVNLRTAKAIGVTIPDQFLALADRVIE
jgi:putative tryptophan/tyrosine transport system substrate-binding protein